ncbi:MAG: antibiotic biosynthesis monooxygenase family protein [Jiangellaceae bacterium]
MKLRVWRYEVHAGSVADFERFYGQDGAWARLFALADGYVGTELYRAVSRPGRYLTVDTFADDASWQRFLLEHRAAYEELDARTSDLTLQEQELV